MSDQLKIDSFNENKKIKPVSIMGIRQNCYRLDGRDGRPDVSPPLRVNRTLSKYYSLEREELRAGFQEQLVQKDYPINSDSVSSYIESSDYRNDPAQAIASAPKRVNLGDISEVQDFIKSNPVDATRQYAEVLQKVSDYFKAQADKASAAKASAAPTAVPTGGENNG